MFFSLYYCICLYILSSLYHLSSASPYQYADLIDKIREAKRITESIIADLKVEWSIDQYPLFYKNILLSHHAWAGMKDRYLKKLINAYIKQKPVSLLALFTGSSVTAGHDSNFTDATPSQVHEIMHRAFSPVDIFFEAKNVALGNNPCMPYDLCMRYFVGEDADLVQWEQTYFCDGQAIIEQFLREAYTMKNKPIVFYTSSRTAKWEKHECRQYSGPSSELELKYLNSSTYDIFTSVNQAFLSHFSYYNKFIKTYSGSSVQFFSHYDSIENYACNGPYIKEWMEGAASWHPSKIAHRFRASQVSFLWLSIWSNTLDSFLTLLDKGLTPQLILMEIEHRLELAYKDGLPPKTFNTSYPDYPMCLTDYEPRMNREISLKESVLFGINKFNQEGEDENKNLWKYDIYENIISKSLVEKSKSRGYQDFKYTLYAPYGVNSGPLSIYITPSVGGTYYACEDPPIWGSLPKGYKHLDEGADIYLTKDITENERNNFIFNPNKSFKLTMKKDSICYQLFYEEDPILPSGKHALTVIAKGESPIILAWIIYSR